jgi:hypothetical protein
VCVCVCVSVCVCVCVCRSARKNNMNKIFGSSVSVRCVFVQYIWVPVRKTTQQLSPSVNIA